ncbi:MAG: PadR family transcriptional regulator [Spirochaetales bacterium]|nr:PadR family transcriptional regulator [Spirochaetales bacterium]
MSAIDLTLLGLVITQPISAYDLAKFVEQHELKDLVRLSIPAIYKNLKKLEQEGFLSSALEKHGEMPEKTVYTITESGRQLFYVLMDKYADEKIKYHFEFNPVIVNLDKLPKPKGKQLVIKLKTRLEKRKQDIKKHEQIWRTIGKTGAVLLSQAQHINDALLVWIDELIHTLQ